MPVGDLQSSRIEFYRDINGRTKRCGSITKIGDVEWAKLPAGNLLKVAYNAFPYNPF